MKRLQVASQVIDIAKPCYIVWDIALYAILCKSYYASQLQDTKDHGFNALSSSSTCLQSFLVKFECFLAVECLEHICLVVVDSLHKPIDYHVPPSPPLLRARSLWLRGMWQGWCCLLEWWWSRHGGQCPLTRWRASLTPYFVRTHRTCLIPRASSSLNALPKLVCLGTCVASLLTFV